MKLSIDIGGTHIRTAKISKSKVINKKVLPTPKKLDDLLISLDKLIKTYSKIDSINISVAGFIKNNKIVLTPHLPLSKYDLKKYLQKKYFCNVKIENDTKCAALAEKKYGNAKKLSNFVYISIGTGIGGAIFINNRLYSGKSFAGELGHTSIKGKEFENLASGKSYNKTKSYPKLVDYLSEEILNINYSLDPEAILLGGSFPASFSKLTQNIQKKIKKRDLLHRENKILISSLGDNASLIGCSLI